MNPKETFLIDRRVGNGAWEIAADKIDLSPGRRLRVFASMLTKGSSAYFVGGNNLAVDFSKDWTYGELLAAVDGSAERIFTDISLRGVGIKGIVQPYEDSRARDPELPPALQDLGDEINEDVREALFTLNSPSYYYPGVDEGIAPVSDDHVALVIWGLQRELNRELRAKAGDATLSRLPAAPLASLSPAVQRALAERRRFRYLQFGIGKTEWETNSWSLWKVPEDKNWVPRRAQRLPASPVMNNTPTWAEGAGYDGYYYGG